MLSVIIPTRCRPLDLIKAVESIICQTRLPSELIIIDQSTHNTSKEKISTLMSGGTCIPLVYVLDPNISGLVEAKNVAVSLAKGDIVCFLEDDVVLEPTFLEEILRGFEACPDMLGCCGVITNPPAQPFYYDFMFHLFHRGIYRDMRVGIYGNNKVDGNALIQSRCISGGLSAWKKEVFMHVPFDLRNGFHMYEDIEFSTRVVAKFGNRLYINTKARLAHYYSPINRLILGARQQRKMNECITFYRKRRSWDWAGISMVWLTLGCLLEASLQSVKIRSIDPLGGCCRGIIDGFSKTLYSN